jgi:hypothetical protein
MATPIAVTFFAIGQNYWGTGKSVAEARRQLKAAGWHRHPSLSKKPITILAFDCERNKVEVYEGFELELRWPKETTAIKWTEEM